MFLTQPLGRIIIGLWTENGKGLGMEIKGIFEMHGESIRRGQTMEEE